MWAEVCVTSLWGTKNNIFYNMLSLPASASTKGSANKSGYRSKSISTTGFKPAITMPEPYTEAVSVSDPLE